MPAGGYAPRLAAAASRSSTSTGMPSSFLRLGSRFSTCFKQIQEILRCNNWHMPGGFYCPKGRSLQGGQASWQQTNTCTF